MGKQKIDISINRVGVVCRNLQARTFYFYNYKDYYNFGGWVILKM